MLKCTIKILFFNPNVYYRFMINLDIPCQNTELKSCIWSVFMNEKDSEIKRYTAIIAVVKKVLHFTIFKKKTLQKTFKGSHSDHVRFNGKGYMDKGIIKDWLENVLQNMFVAFLCPTCVRDIFKHLKKTYKRSSTKIIVQLSFHSLTFTMSFGIVLCFY